MAHSEAPTAGILAETKAAAALGERHDAASGAGHPYHIVAPSPWPITGAFSAFVSAVGAVVWMKGGIPYVALVGLAGILFTMAMWWRDVVREAQGGFHTRIVALSHRYGMMLFIASEVMFFVAWFWAFFAVALFPNHAVEFQRAEVLGGIWPPKGIQPFDPWHLPLFTTLILLTSGTTVTWAHHALLEDDRRSVKVALWLTIALGLTFSSVQAFEYAHAAFAFSANIYGATFFMATGFHGLHVIIGTIFLAVCLYRVYLGHFTPQRHLGFEFAAWYWHFVDVVWLFLFTWIYVWGAGHTIGHG